MEDHLEVALVLRNGLRDLGFSEVVIARDGGGALDQLHKTTVGLVMADLGMAPMSGFDLISAIRKDEQLCDLPVIAVSGTGDAHAVVAAKSAGATAHRRSQNFGVRCANDDLVLLEPMLLCLAVALPPGAIQVFRHHLNDDYVVNDYALPLLHLTLGG